MRSLTDAGFLSWQQDHWLYHCGDGCAYLGEAGRTERKQFPDAVDALRREAAELGWDEDQVADFLDSLTKGGSPTAYVFRCLVCGSHTAHSDFD